MSSLSAVLLFAYVFLGGCAVDVISLTAIAMCRHISCTTVLCLTDSLRTFGLLDFFRFLLHIQLLLAFSLLLVLLCSWEVLLSWLMFLWWIHYTIFWSYFSSFLVHIILTHTLFDLQNETYAGQSWTQMREANIGAINKQIDYYNGLLSKDD